MPGIDDQLLESACRALGTLRSYTLSTSLGLQEYKCEIANLILT